MNRSANNLLRVFEIVSAHGPVTLDGVSRLCELSRSSTFRSLKKLEADNWIRTGLDKRSYVITGHADETISAALPAFSSVDRLTNAIKITGMTRKTHVRIYQQTTTNSFELVDDSMGLASEGGDISSFDFEAVQICLEALQRQSEIVGSTRNSAFDKDKILNVGQYLVDTGFFTCEDRHISIIPVRDSLNNLSIVVIGSKSYFDSSSASSMIYAVKLIEALPNVKLSCFRKQRDVA